MSAKKPHRRGTTNKNQQPNSAHRRRLRQFVIDRDGDGVTVRCSGRCQLMLTIEQVTLDRYPLDGNSGGTYRKDNVRAMCGPCNSSDGSNRMHARLGHNLKGAA